MPYSIELQIASIFFLLILNIVYFSKEKIRTEENKIFTFLIIFTPITILFDISSIFSIAQREYLSQMLVTVLAKCYLISMAVWISWWCRYLVTMGFKSSDSKERVEFCIYLRRLCFIIDCLFVITIAVLPIYYTGEARKIYSYGPSTIALYLFALINWLFSLFCLFIYLKNINWYRRLPVLSYLIIQGTAALLQYFNQSLLLTSFAGSVTIMIIFFTVENPDIELIRALEKAQAKADEANKTKDNFLANMSHEIRTPLNAILGMNEMIMRESKSESITEYSGHIQEAGKILVSLVNDVLDFSKIEAGKMEIFPYSYNMAALLNSIENILIAKIETKGLKLDIVVSPDVPKFLVGDELRVKQILINMLNNAFKYTEKGTITLRISTSSPIIKELPKNIDLSQFILTNDDYRSSFNFIQLHYEIEDTGIGIKKENLATLFDAFNRIEETSHHIEGTGLGLSIANGFLKLMNSQLNIESEYGKGSIFSFDLIQRVTSTEKIGDYKVGYKNKPNQDESKKVAWSSPEAKVLAVDDVRLNLAVVKGLLKKLKIQLDTAQSGAEALEKASKNKYDLILMDHMMPEMDGIETFNKLRELWQTCDDTPTPVVALTANAVVGVREMFIENGFSEYLSKPIDSGKLDKILRQFLPDDKIIQYEES